MKNFLDYRLKDLTKERQEDIAFAPNDEQVQSLLLSAMRDAEYKADRLQKEMLQLKRRRAAKKAHKRY